MILALPAAAAAQGTGETVAVAAGDARLELPVARHRGFPAVELEALSGPVLAEVERTERAVRARLRDDALVLRLGSPFVRVGARVVQLPNAPYREDGAWWIPAALFDPSRTSAAPSAAGPGAAGSAGTGPPPPVPAGPLRVVIDPGHGGRDPGTSTRRIREKDIVLSVATRLRDRLRALPGIEPVLTRDRDVFVPVKTRSNFAVREEAHLFVSIHVNASPSRSARGFETYFLGEARTDESRAVAMRENAALRYESEGAEVPDLDALQYILASLDLTEWRRQSNRLGGLIQNELRRTQPGPDRGVKPGPYWVLVEASTTMPTVLVELGFLSNPADEKWLASPRGQAEIAASLAEAIRAYLDGYSRQLQAAGATGRGGGG